MTVFVMDPSWKERRKYQRNCKCIGFIWHSRSCRRHDQKSKGNIFTCSTPKDEPLFFFSVCFGCMLCTKGKRRGNKNLYSLSTVEVEIVIGRSFILTLSGPEGRFKIGRLRLIGYLPSTENTLLYKINNRNLHTRHNRTFGDKRLDVFQHLAAAAAAISTVAHI